MPSDLMTSTMKSEPGFSTICTSAREGDAVVSMATLSEGKISIEKREEFLKLPLEARVLLAVNNDIPAFSQCLKDEGIELQLLTLDEVLALAQAEQFIFSLHGIFIII